MLFLRVSAHAHSCSFAERVVPSFVAEPYSSDRFGVASFWEVVSLIRRTGIVLLDIFLYDQKVTLGSKSFNSVQASDLIYSLCLRCLCCRSGATPPSPS